MCNLVLPCRLKLRSALGLGLAITTAGLALYSGRTRSAIPGVGNISSEMATRGKDERNGPVKRLVETMVMPNFETSLEMKEQADFMLTPAFLVQAAISEKIVITFPAQ